MHLQIRTKPINSPPDIEKLLGRLAAAGANLGGAGGSDLEFGGEFAMGLEDGTEGKVIEVLEQFEYEYRMLDSRVDPDLTLCWINQPDQPGELHGCVKEVAKANLATGRIIRDILVGIPTREGTPVQIYSEEIRTPQTVTFD